MNKKVAGIDYSMSSPAMVIFDDNEYTFYGIKAKKSMVSKSDKVILFEPVKDYEHNIERYEFLANLFVDILKAENIKDVYIEGYAYGARGNVFNIGENTGILKYLLYKNGINLTVFQPNEIKKVATNKGNANKVLMYEAFKNDGPFDLEDILSVEATDTKIPAPINDMVDAYYVLKTGLTHQPEK